MQERHYFGNGNPASTPGWLTTACYYDCSLRGDDDGPEIKTSKRETMFETAFDMCQGPRYLII
jgi:hypothetical protein